MRLLRVNPTGFFAYGQHAPIELADRGIVLLRGPVGSGKSSLFDATCEILFGNSPKRDGAADVTENDVVNKTLGQAFGVVEFEQAGHYYRVAYLRNWKGPSLLTGPSAQEEGAGGYSGTTVYFEWWDGSRWIQKGPDGQDLRFARMADTWRRVVEVAGIDYGMFCNACYVAQDHALAFIRGKDADREDILTKLMRLACYDDAELKAKERLTGCRRQVESLQSAVATLQVQEGGIVLGDVGAVRTRVAHANDQIAQFDVGLADVDNQIAASRTMADANAAALAQAQAQQAAIVQQIHAKTLEVQRVQADVDRAKHEARAKVASIPTTSPSLDEARRQLAAAHATAALENRRLTSMLAGAGKCPSCGSVLDAQTLAHHKDEQAAVVKAALDAIDVADRTVAGEVASIEQARATRTAEIDVEVAGQVTAIDTTVKAMMAVVLGLEGEKAATLATIRQHDGAAASVKTAELEGARKKLLDDRRAWEIEAANANAAIMLHDQRVADRARITAARAEQERRLAAVNLEAQEWGWLVRNFPRVKQMKFATGSAFLNDALARSLDVLTGGTTHVMINPFRLKKEAVKKKAADLTADDYIFKFEMTVEEGRKTGVPIRLYSGGERERIVLALICSFWELAASQGGGTNVLLLDEAATFLDERSIEGVVRLVERVRETVDTIVLVGHDQALSSLLTADEVWTATKRDDDTTVIEG